MIQRTGAGPLDEAPFVELPFVPPAVEVERRADGCILLHSPYSPAPAARSIVHLLEERASEHPGRPFVLQRDGEGKWQGLSYGEMRLAARKVASWLLEQGVMAERGILILSGNSPFHAVMMFAGNYAGIPSTTVSQPYSVSSRDFGKLEHCFKLIRPGIVYVEYGDDYAAACEALRAIDPSILIIAGDGKRYMALADLLTGDGSAAVDRALERVGPDLVARFIFTSGSTGAPKAVTLTHGMMTAYIACRAALFADQTLRLPPLTIDWMPWSHLSAAMGLNQNLWAGGTLYLDAGRPLPGRFAETVRNLAELSPIQISSAPVAYEMLASALEANPNLAPGVFRNLRWMMYGTAALSQDVYERMQRLAVATTGRRIPFITSYGSTEVHGVTGVYWPVPQVGLLGLPLPGATIKLAPVGDKMEVRVKSRTVTPGYLGDAHRTAEALDDEGFYRMGDAARFVDPDQPIKGLVFDGRITEDFKLATGTWVSVGPLRLEVRAACQPLVKDVVIVGQDERYVGALLWLSAEGERDRDSAWATICERLRAFNARGFGSSRRIARAVLLDAPASFEAGEITEKGYVNQRAVLANRQSIARQLYADPRRPGVAQID